MMPRLRTGLVLGKFLPPHLGHLFLVGCALRQVERLYVVVEHIAGEIIPSTLRLAWLRQLVPEAVVLHLAHPMPQRPEEHPAFWDVWRTALLALLPEPIEAVFASESYGHRLARELGARFLPVDPARTVLPVSGTLVRGAPAEHVRHLPEPVRRHFGLSPGSPSPTPRRVAFVGPESTGKSTAARELAARFDVLCVPEYAETMIVAGVSAPRALTRRDFVDFARGRRAAEETLASFGGRLLLCDSDALTTKLYAELMLGTCPREVADEAAASAYDLTLLFAPDVPWEDDAHRVDASGRYAFFGRLMDALRASGRPTVVVEGDWQARIFTAVAACEALLKN